MRYLILLLVVTLLTTSCGTSTAGHDPFSFNPLTPPAIAALTPNSVPVDSVPFTMSVGGSNFNTDAVVFWNGSPLRTRFVNSGEVMAELTAEDLWFAGLVPVYVRTAGQNSNTVTFNVSIQ